LDILNDIRGNADVYLTNVIENTLRESKSNVVKPLKAGMSINKVDKAG
jgi:hypothetical protein